jgi:hypothetical protein
MNGPTPRQQAGYLKRLLRRGEIEIVDPLSGRAVPVLVSLHGRTIRLTPSPERLFETVKPDVEDESGWHLLFERIRQSVTLEEARELVQAIEHERRE